MSLRETSTKSKNIMTTDGTDKVMYIMYRI